MPQPTNLETARSVETIVRAQGAIPATMGIIGGRIKIGLHANELEHLADVKANPNVVKVSRRDLGPALALQRDGGTTCSTTLMFAAIAGIKVFATGGLGGVHRGGQSSMDVSADLPELSRCPVGLVSAGVKSILDIGRTLEYLETLGVPVVSYGETDDFPAFYTRKSGFKSPWRVDDPKSAARILRSQDQLGMSTGAVFAVPIPEDYETVGLKLQKAVEQALEEADRQGVNKWGKAATPWLLKRVGELTAGKSLDSNVALIKNTARVGGQIAVAYSELAKQAGQQSSPVFQPSSPDVHAAHERPSIQPESASFKAELVIFGSAAVDITAQAADSNSSLGKHSTSPGAVTTSLGGVGRNIAEAAHRVLSGISQPFARSTLLVSPVGNDPFGRLLAEETARLGMRADGLLSMETQRSAVCNMVLDGTGNLIGGVADMGIIAALPSDVITERLEAHQSSIVAADGNLSEHALRLIVQSCFEKKIPVFFEPTSVPKSTRILPAIASVLGRETEDIAPVTFSSPNLIELAHMYRTAGSEPLELTSHEQWWRVIDKMGLGSQFRMELEHLARRDACDSTPAKGTLSFLLDQGVAQMAVNLLPFFQHLILKAGEKGLFTVFRVPATVTQQSAWAYERSNARERQVIAQSRDGGIVVFKHYPAVALQPSDVVNVTGAGDSLVGAALATLVQSPGAFLNPESLAKLAARAQQAAVMTLKSPQAVSPALSTLQ
ncbi:indigoidine synthase A-like protein [Phanerochaete sordida]|uniref:Indigoidine synthase A-like protein n=1 Tax=Phanerochaete sordida TaxID=48140 RepID=A0A9P3G409_9APHY|nr:indigoidine synthase A-like protein [Phanerochaete sordida]